MTEGSSGELSYVYAVTRDEPSGLDTLTGVLDAPVRLVTAAGLHAVVSPVPAAEFARERIEERSEDLDWLAATARAHHRVVDGAGRSTAVAPLALATVFADDDRVRQAIGDRRAEFDAVLDRVRDRVEWGIKAFLPERPPPAEVPAERPASGAEYLRRRRAAVGAAEARTDEAFRAAEELHDTVAAASVASRRHRVHDGALTGRTEQMVLNAAYLVDEADTEQWRAVVGSAASPGLLVEVTGPWAPYSFAGTAPDGGAR
ncbi:GvpL/GvpF family gas vesicle protein [Pseudonocardia sp. HH130630-07]|uniref:GvpL/GvpF family gas vesicle protein n=1 Tax=Pseudonocardia sp. HH130630-07 TaxID=1690815 RepID=UPI000814EC68|nr:GvpL/GvpF family gas vesicle protein [Pseudonocardia sp. HH130630-07]ANY05040.1 hypothetical protein AFB00_00375 [Pseudonocardia sp. HH130630-07]